MNWGILTLGCLVSVVLGAAWQHWMDSGYLVRRAQQESRTAICINGNYYFIVPAREHLGLEAKRSAKEQQE